METRHSAALVHRPLGTGDLRRESADPRPTTDASDLLKEGVEVIRGDLREPAGLAPALSGVDTVVTTANAISRILAGATDLTIADVDGRGVQNLIRAADQAGVRRFVFLSAAGMGENLARYAPFTAAKWEAENALRASRMQIVIVRSDMFQEVWLAPLTGIDPAAGKATIYGRGRTPHRDVAMDDVAALCAHLALVANPPGLVEFGGPEPLTRLEVVEAFGDATGRSMKVSKVPRFALAIGRRVLAGAKPEIASLMGMALYSDEHPCTRDDQPLRDLGLTPRPATA